jgi:hypothetical protein
MYHPNDLLRIQQGTVHQGQKCHKNREGRPDEEKIHRPKIFR